MSTGIIPSIDHCDCIIKLFRHTWILGKSQEIFEEKLFSMNRPIWHTSLVQHFEIKGQTIHPDIISRNLLEIHIIHGNALIDKHGKCSELSKVQDVFPIFPFQILSFVLPLSMDMPSICVTLRCFKFRWVDIGMHCESLQKQKSIWKRS